ncbi:MAG: hypothetical protein H6581_20795 [Bacteroidia bacterium]|nr:hypothetical protein [Bacteroidia bacterium]
MRQALILSLGLLFSTILFAQVEMTPRKAWCEMTKIEDPVAKEIQVACENLLQVYPSPDDINKNEIKRKLFLNKMRGIVKRGATYSSLSPEARNALAASGVQYCNEYLGFKPGDKIETPPSDSRGPLAGRADCQSTVLQYEQVSDCYADGSYLYLSCITAKNNLKQPKTDIQKFWCALKYVAVLLECDQTHNVYK